jgi:hypothetical protein
VLMFGSLLGDPPRVGLGKDPVLSPNTPTSHLTVTVRANVDPDPAFIN